MNKYTETDGYYCRVCPVVAIVKKQEDRPRCNECGRPMVKSIEGRYAERDSKKKHQQDPE